MPDSPNPCCPKCKGTNMVKLEDRLFRCRVCNMLTDGVDDGDIGKRTSPDRYAENKEEFQNRQRNREASRRNRQTGRGRRW